MKAVIQRVASASVSVDGNVVSSIGRGLCVLVGIHRDDTPQQMEYITRKILSVRLFEDENGTRWKKSAKDLDLEILCISQFTLYHVLKGNKPDFRLAMATEPSKKFYAEFLAALRAGHPGGEDRVRDGVFGAMMKVDIVNDGPVTVDIESPPPAKKDKGLADGESEMP